jgi:hypothetical protein
VLGDEGGIHLRLLGGLAIGVKALDGHAHRPERHDEEHDGHGPRGVTHLFEHVDQIETAAALRLCERWGAHEQHSETGTSNPTELNLPTFHRYPPKINRLATKPVTPVPTGEGVLSQTYCNVNCTVTVMMTGTGTPFSNVGVNTH